jgi:hypothetical protein
MTSITTHPYSLDQHTYARLLTRRARRGGMMLYATCLAISLFGLWVRFWVLAVYGILCAVLYAAYRARAVRRYVQDPDNRKLFLEHRLEATPAEIRVVRADGVESRLPPGAAVRVVRAGDGYLVYLARDVFIHVPFGAFASQADRTAFEGLFAAAGVPVAERF